MPGRKRRPVLYEVARRSNRWRRERASRFTRRAAVSTDEPAQTAQPSVLSPPCPPPIEQIEPISAPSEAEPIEAVAPGPRRSAPSQESLPINLKLGAVLAGALIVVGTIAISVSQRPRRPANTPARDLPAAAALVSDQTPIPAARTAQPAAARNDDRAIRVEPAPASEAADAARPARPAKIELKRGFHYIVVQHFPKRKRSQAEASALFLREKGIETALLPGADIRLVVTEPFLIKQDDKPRSRAERQRGEALIRTIKALGKEYRVHGYDFKGAALREF